MDDHEIDRRNQEALESRDRAVLDVGIEVSFQHRCGICDDEACVYTSQGWRCPECFNAL